MLDEQPRRDFANGRLDALGQSLNGKQQLVLLRLDAILFCVGFAEMKEPANLPPEFGQIAVLVVGKVSVSAHICIVTRYKLRRRISLFTSRGVLNDVSSTRRDLLNGGL